MKNRTLFIFIFLIVLNFTSAENSLFFDSDLFIGLKKEEYHPNETLEGVINTYNKENFPLADT
ncbi:MAG: hypothetical protein QW273_02140, partial [Candidatus Pacearchaeota archaeon]